MIKFIGVNSTQIEFSPRPQSASFKKFGATVTKDLLYGHHCNWCGNVIQAFFYTDKQLDLSEYEETRVISQGDKNEGNLRKIVPNSEDFESLYKIDFYSTKKGNAQLIRLKNHLANWKGLSGNRENLFDIGERCCKYIGVSSFSEEYSVTEAFALIGLPMDNKLDFKMSVADFINYVPNSYWENIDYKLAVKVGSAKDMILLPRDVVKSGGNYYNVGQIYAKWRQGVLAKNTMEAKQLADKIAQEAKQAEEAKLKENFDPIYSDSDEVDWD